MTAHSYTRVSSTAQDVDMQRAAIVRMANARGDVITAEYTEKRSAKTIDRPELDRLRANVRAGLVRRLYVYRLDRLARSGISDTFKLIDELRRYNVELVSCADGFDLGGPAAEVIIAVMAWAAKMERMAINERISGARLAMKEQGRAWGRPRKLDRAQLAELARRVDEGQSDRAIAVAMKIAKSTVGDCRRRLEADRKVDTDQAA